jgi:hypothetical protein
MRWTIRTVDKFGVEVVMEYDRMPDFLVGSLPLAALRLRVHNIIQRMGRGYIWNL